MAGEGSDKKRWGAGEEETPHILVTQEVKRSH